MSSPTVEIAITAKNRASSIMKLVSGDIKGVGKIARNVFNAATFIPKSLFKTIFNLKTALAGLGAVMASRAVIDRSLQSYIRLQNAMIGLSTVSDKLGRDTAEMGEGVSVSAEKAKQAAMELSKDGLMSVSEAAMSLKNLLLGGYGLDQAIDMMKAFKDSAAFGRQGTLEFGEAIVGATLGIKNQFSLLVDNAGITKNLSVMQKEYARSIGKTYKQLTEQEKKTAIYIGVMKEAKAMTGDANKMADTYQGALSRMSTNIELTAAAFGKTLAPAIKDFINDTLVPLLQELRNWIDTNQQLIKDGFREWFFKIIEAGKEFFSYLRNNSPFQTFRENIRSMKNDLAGLVAFWTNNREMILTLAGLAYGYRLGGIPGMLAGGFAGMAYGNYTRNDAQAQGLATEQSLGRGGVELTDSAAAALKQRPQQIVIQNPVFSGVPDARVRQ